jgi:hypothetical protein
MQKAFYSDDLLEFKINHKWTTGNLKDIIKDENKFILSLNKENQKLFEYQNPILLINCYKLESLLKNSESSFSHNQRVEFFDETSNSWTEGTIETINKDFYLISYATKGSLNNSKILFKNNIRPLSNDKDLLKLNINNLQCFSLKDFQKFSNPEKYAKKFVKKLTKLLNDKISVVFLNRNFDLFIFSNDNSNSVKQEIIDGLIDVAVKHFHKIDKENKKLFK